MPELADVWTKVLPEVRNAVTGVGVWTALNTAKAVVLDDGILVMGLPQGQNELGGHLRRPDVTTIIERHMSSALGKEVRLRVIDGILVEDWEITKKRDVERQRLAEQALNRTRAEIQARSSWETIYEQLNRKFAGIGNKSLPQNRARFFMEATEIVIEHRKQNPIDDDLGERNYARCIERIAQYTELPSVYVALMVMDKVGD